jgi:riboflavin synthase alpha subunit
VALIPETLARTNLGALRLGQTVNVETDILMRMSRKKVNFVVQKRRRAG